MTKAALKQIKTDLKNSSYLLGIVITWVFFCDSKEKRWLSISLI